MGDLTRLPLGQQLLELADLRLLRDLNDSGERWNPRALGQGEGGLRHPSPSPVVAVKNVKNCRSASRPVPPGEAELADAATDPAGSIFVDAAQQRGAEQEDAGAD